MVDWAPGAKIIQIRISNVCDQRQIVVTLDEVEDLQAESAKILVGPILCLHSLSLHWLVLALLDYLLEEQYSFLHPQHSQCLNVSIGSRFFNLNLDLWQEVVGCDLHGRLRLVGLGILLILLQILHVLLLENLGLEGLIVETN